jgi:hypothetical protein
MSASGACTHGRAGVVCVVTLALTVVGCTSPGSPEATESTGHTAPTTHSSPSAGTTPAPGTAGTSPRAGSIPDGSAQARRNPDETAGPKETLRPRFDARAAMADVRTLAGRIGPRLATGPGYRQAARLVQRRLEHLGYDVRRQVFAVPAGDSWGVPVRAGRSSNVVATPPGFDRARPHLVVGAHLDTVAVAPGAEDNASGVGVLLETARLAAAAGTRLPVVWVAFGAEEPRGPGDDLHHFGSRHYVRAMSRSERESLRAMVSLDRVGVGQVVPVCTGPLSPERVQRQLVRAGGRAGVPAVRCENTASDHWSFEKADVAVARLGSTSYAAYHSPRDLPRVVDRRQLGRTGRLLWAWLSRGG